MEFREWRRTPDRVGELWAKFWERRHKFPAGDGDSLPLFLEMIYDPGTIIFELGEFGGVVIITQVPQETRQHHERIAIPHFVIWDRQLFRVVVPELRKRLPWFMRAYRLDRLLAESPVELRGIHRILEAIGFRKIGLFRQRKRQMDGKGIDMYLYDLLASDLEDMK